MDRIRNTSILAALAIASLLAPLAAANDLNIEPLIGEDWYGLYMNGEKVGYAVNSLRVEDDGHILTSEKASFKMNMVGMKQDMRINSVREFDADGNLLRIDAKIDDIAGTNEFHATVHDNGMTLVSIVGGQKRETSMPPPEETLQDMLKAAQLAQPDAEPGDTVEFSIFEPMYGGEIGGVSTLEGTETRHFDGVDVKVYRIRTVMKRLGIASLSFVSEDGTILEDQIGGGILTMRLEPEEIAKDVSYSNDVIVSNAAKIDEPIERPRTRETLRLEIRGPLQSEHLFNDERQAIKERDGYFSFIGTKTPRDTIEVVTLPITQENVTPWLEPTTFVQSDNERLIAKAKEIVGDETDAMAIVEKLSAWVYDNVRTTFSARLTNSLEVLDHMEGDCTEHSMLFIGLARAAGLPAREVAGLIYVEGPQPGFYFHQWATVWVGKWIDVDPTFNQPIADATHIKLAEGDLFEQTKLLPIIGQLDIKVAEEANGQ